MGLFSSKKKHYVGSSMSRAIEDNMLYDTVVNSAFTSIMDKRDYPAVLTNSMLTGLPAKMERMQRKISDEVAYWHLRPFITLENRNQSLVDVEEALKSLLNTSVIHYFIFGYKNLYHLGWQEADDLGWDSMTNELTLLSAQKGTTVYLEDLVPVIAKEDYDNGEDEILIANGPSAKTGNEGATFDRNADTGRTDTPFIVSDVVANSGVILKYVYWLEETIEPELDANGDPIESPTTIITKIVEERFVSEGDVSIAEQDYFQVSYRNSQGKDRYWTYMYQSGGHPSLDSILNPDNSTTTPTTLTDYNNDGFPFIFFRKLKAPIEENLSEFEIDRYRDYLDVFNMNFDEIKDQIASNEDIDNVQQAVLLSGVNVLGKGKGELDYLWRFFATIYSLTLTDPVVSVGTFIGTGENNISWQDRTLISMWLDFHIDISFSGIVKSITTEPGIKGQMGSDVFTQDTANQYLYNEGYYKDTRIIKNGSIAFWKQTGDNEKVTYIINDLACRYYVYAGKNVAVNLTNVEESEVDIIVPLLYPISKELPFRKKEEVYQKSLHFLFNSRQTVSVKWYQTGIFKTFITIISIGIVIMSGGSGAGFAAALSTMTAASLVWTAIKIIIQKVVFDYVIKIAAEKLGDDVAFLLAIAAALYGSYQFLSTNGSAMMGNLGLSVSRGMSEAVSESYIEKIEGIQTEFETLQEESRKAKEVLDRYETELGLPNIDKLIFMATDSLNDVEGEAPGDFFSRTVHAGNIGPKVYDYLQNHVDISLSLKR